MNEPTGYTALDLIGYTDRGDYSAVATYVKNDLTNYGGTKWRCLVDDTTGVTPTEGVNWTVFVAIPADTTKQILAPVEGATSLHAYAVGKQLIYNDTLYKVIAPIAVNDALVVDTNIEVSPKTVVEQVEDLDASKMSYAVNTKLGAKNLLENKATTQTLSGVTFTINSDGSVTVNTNGVTTENAFIELLPNTKEFAFNENYILTGCPAGGGENTYGLHYRIGNDSGDSWVASADDFGEGGVNLIGYNPSTQHFRVYISIRTGVTLNNVKFYPMIRLADDTDPTYAPYAMTNGELTNSLKSLFLTPYIANGATYTGNCNDLEPGLVYVGSGATNSPGNYYLVFTFSVDLHEGKITGYGTQIGIGITTQNIKTRICNSGTWSAWKTITPV